MELRGIERARRKEQLSQRTADRVENAVQPQTAPARSRDDRVALSRQALAFLEEQNRQAQERARQESERKSDYLLDRLNELNGKKDELDNLGKQLKVMHKCQKIAARVMAGDKVPPEDLQYLMNNDPDGYKLAMALRRHKEDPEEHESVLDDEDRGRTAGDSGTESPAVSQPAPSAETGGGDTAAEE